MTRVLLLAGLLCSGCLVVPAKRTSIKNLGTEEGALTLDKVREVALAANIDRRVVRVHAVRSGECVRPVFAVREVTTSKRAALGGASDPRGKAFGFLLSPITIPLSAIYTGLVVASDSPETTKQTKPAGIKRFRCSLNAESLAVSITLPSGAVVREKTNDEGRAELEIPDGEPVTGALTVTAESAPPVQLAYALPRPPITVARDAMTECGTKHAVTGTVTLKLSINESGRATRLWTSAGDTEFKRCVSKLITGLRFPGATHNGTLALPVEIPAPGAASLPAAASLL